jgi:hypothetical protein
MSATSGINVAGTTALGDYLSDEISNTQTLLGSFAPATGVSAVLTTLGGVTSLQQDGNGSLALAEAQAAQGAQSAGAAVAPTPPASTTPPNIASSPSQGEIVGEGQDLDPTSALLSSLGIGSNVNALS